MKDIYIITGANGHLGNTIIRILERQIRRGNKNIADIRGLILPGEEAPFKGNSHLHWFYGDVTDETTLEQLFENVPAPKTSRTKNTRLIFIHTAGIIDITSSGVSEKMRAVNVGGTKNVVHQAMAHHVDRFIYVSSVHAIPERPDNETMIETKDFDPEKVVGGYAKTKAEATRFVLDSVEKGLPAVVVHPSGIIGPYDSTRNHLVAVIRDYISGKLPACVRGGYDFVDVRDVAQGCLAAVDNGRIGECYILSNTHCEIKNVLDNVKNITGTKPIRMIPLWLARFAAPFLSLGAKMRHRKPLYTKYSLYTLGSNGRFSHAKATRDLDYQPRSLGNTLKDTVRWLRLAKARKPFM